MRSNEPSPGFALTALSHPLPRAGEGKKHQSIVAPLAFTGASHFLISEATNFER